MLKKKKNNPKGWLKKYLVDSLSLYFSKFLIKFSHFQKKSQFMKILNKKIKQHRY